jgi:hypothetical protein
MAGSIFLFYFSSERQKWPLGVAGSLSPWLFGWITATPSGPIFFLFAEQVTSD